MLRNRLTGPPHIVQTSFELQIKRLGYKKKLQEKSEAAMRTPLQRASKNEPLHDIDGPYPLAPYSGSLVRFGDSCISLLGNHVLACISIVCVKKLAIFLHKTIAIWPTDQMHKKFKSPSISLCLPT